MAQMAKVVAIVGMSGSGKSEAARVFEQKGFIRIRFGDITDEEVRKRGLALNEENERRIREELRKEDMAAYARLNLPRIESSLMKSNVIIDGLYSWEEYKFLKGKYGDDLIIVSIYSSPKTRYGRLAQRHIRPLTGNEARSRDHAEIENLNKGGPIAMADYTIMNEVAKEELLQEIERLINRLEQ